jgi:glucose/arabinose dehydrogenase
MNDQRHVSKNKKPIDKKFPRNRVGKVESLEQRQLLSTLPPNVGVPYTLEFDRSVSGVKDKDGTGTGFQRTQGNRLGTESRGSLLDIRPTSGILNITTTGAQTQGSPYQADNTLVNGLQSLYDARNPFTVSTRIQGPLTQFNTAGREAGIIVGQGHDNFVSLTIAGTSDGPRIRFYAEGKPSSTFTLPKGPLGQRASFSNDLSTASRIDLVLIAKPTDGTFDAYFGFSGEALRRVGSTLRLDNYMRGQLFRNQQRAGVMAFNRSTSPQVNVRFERFNINNTEPTNVRPEILGSTPASGATNVARDAGIVLQVRSYGDGVGIDGATLTGATRLVKISDSSVINGFANTSGGGDTFVFTPNQILQANTQYRLEVSSSAADTAGNQFLPFSTTFTTGTTTNQNFDIAWDKSLAASWAQDKRFSHINIGPDGRAYVSDLDGNIYRASINPDGTLATPTIIDTIRDNNGNVDRFIAGFAFDPRSTPSNVILWVNHTEYNQDNTSTGTNFTSKLSRLTGSNLQTYDDAITNLPRSAKDHIPGVPAFGPDGNLYFSIGSNSSEGSSDSTWANRPESMLTAAILKLDISDIETQMSNTGALNARTIDVGGSYDPFASNVPLTLYATGIRNAYQIYWDSNGKLYATGNRSGTGGNTPGTPADLATNPVRNRRIDFATNGAWTQAVPALNGINNAANTPDPLFVVQQGKYYGHPNPSRAEYIAYGGNPTGGVDPNEVPQYPVGTQPDRNYVPQSLNFEVSTSPNSTIRYQNTDFFGGQLSGKLIVGRFSSGKDLVAVDLNGSGNPTGFQSITPRSFNFDGPLSVVETPGNGNLYVVDMERESSDPAQQYKGQIFLLKPMEPSGLRAASVGSSPIPASTASSYSVSRRSVEFTAPQGTQSKTLSVVVNNRGTSDLSLAGSAISITGSNAGDFRIIGATRTIAPGRTGRINVAFTAPSNAALDAIRTATLVIRPVGASSSTNVSLRGLPTKGLRAANEPSLQRLFELFNIRVRSGDSDPTTSVLEPGVGTDEQAISGFVKAGSGPVSVQVLANMTEGTNGVSSSLAFYNLGTPTRTSDLFRVPQADEQTANPDVSGSTRFDPGSSAFGLAAMFSRFTNLDDTSRVIYSEPALNTWEPNADIRRKMRVFPLKDSAGNTVANSYVVAVEEFTLNPGDFNDAVYILRNVRPVQNGPVITAGSADASVDAPVDPTRLVFNQVQNRDNNFAGQRVQDTNVLRIQNTGNAPMQVTSISIPSNQPFRLTRTFSPFTLNPGSTRDIRVRFTASTGPAVQNGTMTIRTNSVNGSTLNVPLSGLWQQWSENNPSTGLTVEPTLQNIIDAFGMNIRLTNSGQNLDNGGANTAVGDEVLSPYWKVADTAQPVVARAIATWRQMGLPGTLRWHPRNDPNQINNIVSANNLDAQSVFPRSQLDDSKPAQSVFRPSADEFGFRIENIWSDQEQTKDFFDVNRDLHQIRFYPARTPQGVIVPNTWLLVMDNFSPDYVNYDFQDNVYLISNIRPADLPATVINLQGVKTESRRVELSWASTNGATSYDVLRSSSARGTFTRVASGITSTTFNDTAISSGSQPWFYQVVARSGSSVSVADMTTVL